MVIRSIVHIDQEKCDGCGLCVPSCEEGAIRIVEGKARIVSEVYCDGLGACLGHCPRGAISIVQREAAPFDEAAVARHMASQGQVHAATSCAGSCPGSAAVSLHPAPAASRDADAGSPGSQLGNWPVQLHLVPPHAPWLYQCDLLLAADCVPFACPDFHARILRGRRVLVGCPKLDDCGQYVAKLAAIIRQAEIRSIAVAHMEVPCCTGLVRVARAAIQQAGITVPLHDLIVTRHGEVLESSGVAISGSGVSLTGVQLPVV